MLRISVPSSCLTACIAAALVVPSVASAQSAAPTGMASDMPGMSMPGDAMPMCKATDPVVWVNTKSKVYYTKGASLYGKTKHGKYACESAATAAGDHPVKMSGMGSMSSHSMASPMPGSTGGIETNQMPNTTSSSSPSP